MRLLIPNLERLALSKKTLTVTILISLALGAAFIIRHQTIPIVADAWSYQFYAFRFRFFGFLHDFGSIRTYGYPAFLYPLTFLSGFRLSSLALVTGIAQYLLFLIVTLWLAIVTARHDSKFSWAILFGLLLNPFLVSHVTEPLSDGLSISLFIGLTTLAFLIAEKTTFRRGAFLIVVGAFLTAYALMVRPANIAWIIAWYLALGFAFSLAPQWQPRREKLALFTIGCFIVAGAAVWGPQILYNNLHYNHASIFPVCSLGGLNTLLGLLYWKLDGIIKDGNVFPLHYLNPLFQEAWSQSAWHWYLENPGKGILTILAHIFNAFSITSLFSYTFDKAPFYGPALRLGYWFLMIAGAANIYHHIRSRLRYGAAHASHLSAISFIGFSFIGIVALNSIVPVELRYNLIPVGILCVFAVDFGRRLFSGELDRSSIQLFRVGITAIACVGFSYFVDRTASYTIEGRGFVFDNSRCQLTTEETGDNFGTIAEDFKKEMRQRRN